MFVLKGNLQRSDDKTVPPQPAPAAESGEAKRQLKPEHDAALDEKRESSQLFVTEWSFADR